MSEHEQIENRIKILSPEELARLRAWFEEFDALAWDRQIESASARGSTGTIRTLGAKKAMDWGWAWR